jgi:hypothetical protein
VVLFGPVSPTEWGPPPDRLQHRVLWAGRTGDPHGDLPDPGLLAITTADVVAQLDCLDQLECHDQLDCHDRLSRRQAS